MNRLLLIGPSFFDYMTIIKTEIEKRGYIVDYVDDRPKFGFFGKAFLRLFPKKMLFFVDRYVNQIIKEFSPFRYNKVLVILGQSFNKSHILKLKKNFKNSEFVYYAWDSSRNFKNISEIFPLFDRSYTFDEIDSKNNNNFKFLPLFYSYNNGSEFSDKKKRALLFMTIKKGKMEYINKISKCINGIIPLDKTLFLQSRLVFLYYKLTDRSFRNCKMKDFVYKRTSYKNALKTINEYKFIIDIPMKNQTGLTIRTFEALALNCKIITSNQYIKFYDFYNQDNIFIYNEDLNKSNLDTFLSSNDYEQIDLTHYSLDSFISVLLGEQNEGC